MKTINAIMAGMSRAGTSFMYHNLQKHPQIFLPARKEVCFFAHNFNKGIEWYKNFFNDKKENEIAIDICGVYFTDNEALDRLKSFEDNPKIILCIRNPYEWIYSFYEQYSNGFNMPSFEKFITKGCTIDREGEKVHIDFRNEKVSKTIEAYMQTFKGRILIYDFAFFEKEPLTVLKAIENFLEVENWFNDNNFNNSKINASGRKGSKLFDRMLQIKGVVALILKLFPKSLILKLREKRELKEAKGVQKVILKDKYSDKEQNLVKSLFENDHKYISELFKQKSIIEI
ncbi:MAG: sulfotransferase domain-containing protein [Candidatus Marinarcus sp.]|uniref:sulfotransferase domain-containing protein n=1 Tax=Candidatus Marinarcus sp. TaxID=3100987 RepID=UPI003B00A5AA